MSQRQNGVDRFFHSDWLGSTRYLTDGTGLSAPTAYRFDGYGNVSAQAGPDATSRKFAGGHGYESDGPAGLQLLGHRFYDPAVGRFLNPDPIGFAGGLNLYAYCESDPVGAVDFKGLRGEGLRGYYIRDNPLAQRSRQAIDNLIDSIRKWRDRNRAQLEAKTPWLADLMDGGPALPGGPATIEFAKPGATPLAIFNCGGRFSYLNNLKDDVEVGHHIPQNAFLKEIGVSRDSGFALGMLIKDHIWTRTFCGRGSKAMRTDAGLTPRQRVYLDITAIRGQFGRKYNKGLLEMLREMKDDSLYRNPRR